MSITKLSPPYLPLTQQKTLCVPCAIQWILYRRGLKLIDQEKLAKALNFVNHPKNAHLYIEKLKFTKKKPKQGYGTQADLSSIAKAFKKFKIHLKVEYFPISKIDDPVDFIKQNLKANNDLLSMLNMRPLNPKKSHGHGLVIAALEENKTNKVLFGDPSYNSKKFWWADLDKVLKGMTDKYDGVERGFYVFKGS